MRRLKVCLVGDAGVGKTSLATRYVHNVFSPDITFTTVGAQYFPKSYDATTDLEIWDTAGQERYRALVPLYFRNAAAVIVVVDASSPAETLVENALRWIAYVRDTHGTCPIVVALSKIDLVDERDSEQAPLMDVDGAFADVGVAQVVRTTSTTSVAALFDCAVDLCNRDTTPSTHETAGVRTGLLRRHAEHPVSSCCGGYSGTC